MSYDVTGLGSFVSGAVGLYNSQQSIEHNQQMEAKRERLQIVLSALGVLQQFTIHHLDQVALRKRQEEARQLQEEARQLQTELAVYNRQTQLMVAETQRTTALALPETNQVFANWPLHLYPSQILTSHPNAGSQPLKILVAPPEVEYDRFKTSAPTGSSFPQLNEGQLMAGLRHFLEEHYPLESSLRPTELLDGAWDSKRFRGGSSIKALHSLLKSEPILILELAGMGEHLELRVGYWGLGQEKYHYKTVGSKLSLRHIVQEVARLRTLAWKDEREPFLQRGYNETWLKQRNPVSEENLSILNQNAEFEGLGWDSLPYKIHSKDFDSIYRIIVSWLSCVSGWFTDAHHLLHTAHPEQVPPLLPSLLQEWMEDSLAFQFLHPLLAELIRGYHTLLQELRSEQPYCIPELALQMATSLSSLSDKTWAQEMLKYALQTRLELSGITVVEGSDLPTLLQAAEAILDQTYIENLMHCLEQLGDTSGAKRFAPIVEVLRQRGIGEKSGSQPPLPTNNNKTEVFQVKNTGGGATDSHQPEKVQTLQTPIVVNSHQPEKVQTPHLPATVNSQASGMMQALWAGTKTVLSLAAAVAGTVMESDTFKVLQVLHQFASQNNDIYIAPNISSKKLSNAKTTCQVPSNEDILGLIDCTYFGSADNCVLFGSQVIYYHHDGGFHGKILYADLPQIDFFVDGKFLNITGGGKIKMAGSTVSAKELSNILRAIKQRMSS